MDDAILAERSGAACAAQSVELWFAQLDDLSVHIPEGNLSGSFGRRDPKRDRAISHQLLRQLLARRNGCTPADLVFAKGAHGKPALAGAGTAFSLSRSNGVTLIGISDAAAIGVDVEFCKPVDEQNGITDMFHPRERAFLNGMKPAERLHWFYRIWTRKEAVLKATGTGLLRALDSFSVVGHPTEFGARTSLSGHHFFLYDLTLPGGAVGALATTENASVPQVRLCTGPLAGQGTA
ncbi:4'-phosphopantetheinyl transferase family protein [Roseobacter sp. S98]|uniref:4'-phosphopantetheinyl transferase family protein n=1 Tax=Roseobacter algicola (ex Choi et al. 2025) (nom. illeg.) TaxID=3092138 RepID=UPI0035C6FF76